MTLKLELSAGIDQYLAGADTDAPIRRSVLPGGIRLLTERDPNVRSVCLGFWLPVGSRDELPQHAGSTHVLEHLLFKGTKRRSAKEIAEAFDEIGGESNALTAKEHTCYYGRVRSADLDIALDVLADMVTQPAFDPEAYQMEREVILEELAMAEDTPTDCGHEAFMQAVLGDNAVGRPVGGTPEIIKALQLEAVKQHYREHYVPENLVVTAVGDIDHDDLADRLQNVLKKGGWKLLDTQAPRPRRAAEQEIAREIPSQAGQTPALSELNFKQLKRPIEQTHIFIGGAGLNATAEERNVLASLQAILGGGMSSRLFQSIREEKGLAYTVYSFSSGYNETGVFGMYAATRPANADEVAQLMLDELNKIAADGVSETELQRVLGQMSGGIVLGLEDTSSRMARLGSAELVHGEYRSVDESIARTQAVTCAQIQALAGRLAAGITTRLDVGPEVSAQAA